MNAYIAKFIFILKEAAVRLAIAILRNRVTTDLKKIGYVRDEKGMWKITREDMPGVVTTGASMHEASAIRMLLDDALITQYPTKLDKYSPPQVQDLKSTRS